MVKRPEACLGAIALVCAALAACDSNDPPATPPSGLDARQILIRASLDVRGVRPSAEELATVQEAPAELDRLVAGFVNDARFGDRIRSIFADAVRTRQDFYRPVFDYGLEPRDTMLIHRAIAEEAPNLVGYVAVQDMPFTEILTADYTIIDPVMLQYWPLAQSADQPAALPRGTVKAHYTDSRPVAGILATNAFFWRHTSTVDNANRGRSNAVSRALLCEDYLDRPIDFPRNVDLTDPESIKNAIRTNPGCQACHATLDPFASHLWGFMHPGDDTSSWDSYQPANERMWMEETEATPAFFGTPTDGTLSGLAVSIANDERFVACAVRRVYEAFVGRSAAMADEGQLAAHREAFVASGLSLKSLVISVLTDPAYRGLARQSSWGATPEPVAVKLASPELLSSSLFDLSGYRMTAAGREVTEVDFAVRALAGGSERGAAASPSLGHALVHRRLAEASARSIVERLASSPASRVGRVLERTSLGEPPSNDTLVALVREIQSRDVAADSQEVEALQALYLQVAAGGTPDDAWSAVLTALFADPEMAIY